MKTINAEGYDTDRICMAHYLKNDEGFKKHFVDKTIVMLELGVLKGGSLLVWRDCFQKGTIVGLDLAAPSGIHGPADRIHLYQGPQEDSAILKTISAREAPGGFDIIIDDCSYIGRYAMASFRVLFGDHLKPGGIYAIEDWGTGYWSKWPDGRQFSPAKVKGKRIVSHDYGMAGFVKSLVDECATADITDQERGRPPIRASAIKFMHISHGHVIVVKEVS
jgi:hypothetical protein